MTRLVPIVAALLFLPACGSPAPEPELMTVDDVWIKLPAVPGRPAAAYFTIRGGGEPVRLLGVRTHAADRAELHDSRMAGGMTRMAPLKDVAIGPHQRVVFAPGGRHAMLFGVSERTTIDTQPTFVFRFSNGHTVTRGAFVLTANDPPPRFAQPETGRPCHPFATRSFYEVVITDCDR